MDFRDLFADSRRYTDSHFTVLVRDRGSGTARLGLAISKKVAKKAVHRNRLRRIILESFRTHRADLSGMDMVVMCRSRAKEVTSAVLYASLITHWITIKRDQRCVCC